MKEQQFWEVIEAAWAEAPDLLALRQEVFTSNDEAAVSILSERVCTDIAGNLERRLTSLSKKELTQFILLMEQKLFEIDREEIHRYTNGSDDGFLYCRCFIVGMGQAYYEKINQTPSLATPDAEAEEIGFVGYGVYEERFCEEFDRYSVHSIESGSNPAGWSPEPYEFIPLASAAQPPLLETVRFDEVEIVRDLAGWETRINWADLKEVALFKDEANSDTWLRLSHSGTCVVNFEALGLTALYERLQQLPGFDRAAARKVLTATSSAHSTCWRRGETAS